MKRLLYSTKNDKKYSIIHADINEDGALVISGHDMGEDVEAFWGDSDYEYWLVIDEAHKEALLASLGDTAGNDETLLDRIATQFNVQNAVGELKAWCEKRAIPYSFNSYI